MLFGTIFIFLCATVIGGVVYCFVAEDLRTRRHIGFIKDVEGRTGKKW